jgi:hypothetical protein
LRLIVETAADGGIRELGRRGLDVRAGSILVKKKVAYLATTPLTVVSYCATLPSISRTRVTRRQEGTMQNTTTHDDDGLAHFPVFPEPERIEAFRRALPDVDPIAQMRSACAIFTDPDIRTQLEERIQAIRDVVSGVSGARDNFDLDSFRL